MIDPDVNRLLDDSDLSRFGSDVDDLEEDFVLMANQPDGEEEEKNEKIHVKKINADVDVKHESGSDDEVDDEPDYSAQHRVRRPVDEEFDEVSGLLTYLALRSGIIFVWSYPSYLITDFVRTNYNFLTSKKFAGCV